MKNLQIWIMLCVFIICDIAYSNPNQDRVLSEEQVQKLADAAWKQRSHNIDVMLFLKITTPPKPDEQIRQEVEKSFEKDIEALGENPHPLVLQRIMDSIDRNIQRRIKSQQFPRLIKKRIRISGNKQRTDSVIAEPGKRIDPNEPLDTFVNVGERNSPDFFSFHYYHKLKQAVIRDGSGWSKRDPARFAHMPLGPASALQAFLGRNQRTIEEPVFILDSDKMETLSRTGLSTIEYVGGIKVNGVNRILISPAPDSPDTREQIEIGDPNYLPTVVMICDKEDYSRVYNLKFCNPLTGEPFYIRECSNFDAQGFPRNVTETQYDMDGNLKKKSVYNIVNVELNPSFPDDLFTFKPPEGYKVVDNRTKKP